jgi:hypothetical protein
MEQCVGGCPVCRPGVVMDQVKVQGCWGRFVVCTLLLSATLGSSALHAQSSGLPDLAQVSRAGLELMPAVPGVAGEPGPRVFPFEPLERDPTDGLRHGWVTTTTGRFGFTITELTLPARVPFAVGRVWDGGMGALLPGVPTQEPRPANDFGPNWMFWPTSALIPTSSTTMCCGPIRGMSSPMSNKPGVRPTIRIQIVPFLTVLRRQLAMAVTTFSNRTACVRRTVRSLVKGTIGWSSAKIPQAMPSI